MGANPESDGQDRQMAEAVNSEATNWMKRGLALLTEDTPAGLKQALQCFDRALELRRHLPVTGNHSFRFGLAMCWMSRGDALTRLGGDENFVEALNCHGQAIALLCRLPLDENPVFRRRMAIAWLNRGLTLQAQGTPKSVAEAVRSFDQSVHVLRAGPSLDDPEDQRLLGSALTSHSNALLLAEGPLGARKARKLAQEALRVIGTGKNDPLAAEAGFKARHVLCQAISFLLGDEATTKSVREELVDEATDAVDEGMEHARHWEQQGVDAFRPLVSGLFRFGSGIYQAHQPHFLGEFLLESLDPAHAPGAIPNNHEMHAAAITALRRALGEIQRNSFTAINTPRFEQILEMLRELRVTEARLAELRQRHLTA